MKASYLALSGKVRIEIEAGTDIKELFAQLAEVAEVFGEETCGQCDSAHIMPVSRTNQGFTFYEIQCRDCQASLQYGQPKDGGLFPKRKLADGSWDKKHRGWVTLQERMDARDKTTV